MDNFLRLGYTPEQSIILHDMQRAVTRAKLWQYIMATPINYTDKELVHLQKYIRYDKYTPESYAWALNEVRKFHPQPKTHFTALWKDFVQELQQSDNPGLREFADKVKQ